MRSRFTILAVILCGCLSRPANCAILANDRYRVVIAEAQTGAHAPGSLLEFSALWGDYGDALAGMDYSGSLTAGSFQPQSGTFVALSDTEGVFVSPCLQAGGITLPARTTFTYLLTQHGLDISWRLDCDEAVTFTEGMQWRWHASPWALLQSFNQVGQTDSLNPASAANRVYPLRSAWKFSNGEKSLWILQPDPLQARWIFEGGALKQEWLHSRPPNTSLPASQFPKIASMLSPAHSIWGNVSLQIASPEDNLPYENEGWVFLAGMPQGAEQGFIYMWDEFPLSWDNNWNPLTTPNNPATPVGSNIVQLLLNHPAMKNVLLLAMDKQLSGYPFKPSLPGWSVPESFVCIDTIEQIEGSGALTVSHYTSRTTWVTQTIACLPNEVLQLSGWNRVDSINGGWAGIYLEGDSTTIQIPAFVVSAPQPWAFQSAQVSTGPNQQLTLNVGMAGGPGKARFDDLQLKRAPAPENLLDNAGFNNFNFSVTYDGEGLQWWHAHGQRRITTMAPQDYLEWLQFIESDGIEYGWEDRACLGMHCYHHTPNELYPLGGANTHEFNFYDPAGDSARFYMIHRDLADCGLADTSFEVFRFPGHRHQMPTVLECIKHGVSFLDRGLTSPGSCLLGAIILPEGIIWETNSNWWSDETEWWDVPTMQGILDRGELVLAGGHPGGTFPIANPSRFEVVDGVFDELELLFPNMNYYFPAEFSSFCEESRGWWGVQCSTSDSGWQYHFNGSATRGQTLVASVVSPESLLFPPLLDGFPISAEIRGNRVFMELPFLPVGGHDLVLQKGVGIEKPPVEIYLPTTISIGIPFPNPTNAWVTIPLELPEKATVKYRLVDLLGRLAMQGSLVLPEGLQRLQLHADAVPSGAYFMVIEAGDRISTQNVCILK